MKNRQWRVARYPDGPITPDCFAYREEPVPEPDAGRALVRQLFLSLDPTNRVWLSPFDTYLPQLHIGEVMRGLGLGIVERSCTAEFKAGDLVYGFLGWQDYALIAPEDVLRVERHPAVPLDAYAGSLTMIGLTAYFGMNDVGGLKAGDNVLVSGAAGATGSLAGQIAKMQGARVIGIAGGAEKCKRVVEEFGFDGVIDYKNADVAASVAQYFPKGIDLFFDNVGGSILAAAMNNMAYNGRLVICGAISQYEDGGPGAWQVSYVNVILRRLTIRGFIVFDYYGPKGTKAREAMMKLENWYVEGKLHAASHIVEGLERAPEAVSLIFTGGNQGKLLIKVSS